MKQSKRILLAVMSLLMLAAIFGCGSKDVTGNDDGGNPKYKETSTK